MAAPYDRSQVSALEARVTSSHSETQVVLGQRAALTRHVELLEERLAAEVWRASSLKDELATARDACDDAVRRGEEARRAATEAAAEAAAAAAAAEAAAATEAAAAAAAEAAVRHAASRAEQQVEQQAEQQAALSSLRAAVGEAETAAALQAEAAAAAVQQAAASKAAMAEMRETAATAQAQAAQAAQMAQAVQATRADAEAAHLSQLGRITCSHATELSLAAEAASAEMSAEAERASAANVRLSTTLAELGSCNAALAASEADGAAAHAKLAQAEAHAAEQAEAHAAELSAASEAARRYQANALAALGEGHDDLLTAAREAARRVELATRAATQAHAVLEVAEVTHSTSLAANAADAARQLDERAVKLRRVHATAEVAADEAAAAVAARRHAEEQLATQQRKAEAALTEHEMASQTRLVRSHAEKEAAIEAMAAEAARQAEAAGEAAAREAAAAASSLAAARAEARAALAISQTAELARSEAVAGLASVQSYAEATVGTLCRSLEEHEASAGAAQAAHAASAHAAAEREIVLERTLSERARQVERLQRQAAEAEAAYARKSEERRLAADDAAEARAAAAATSGALEAAQRAAAASAAREGSLQVELRQQSQATGQAVEAAEQAAREVARSAAHETTLLAALAQLEAETAEAEAALTCAAQREIAASHERAARTQAEAEAARRSAGNLESAIGKELAVAQAEADALRATLRSERLTAAEVDETARESVTRLEALLVDGAAQVAALEVLVVEKSEAAAAAAAAAAAQAAAAAAAQAAAETAAEAAVAQQQREAARAAATAVAARVAVLAAQSAGEREVQLAKERAAAEVQAEREVNVQRLKVAQEEASIRATRALQERCRHSKARRALRWLVSASSARRQGDAARQQRSLRRWQQLTAHLALWRRQWPEHVARSVAHLARAVSREAMLRWRLCAKLVATSHREQQLALASCARWRVLGAFFPWARAARLRSRVQLVGVARHVRLSWVTYDRWKASSAAARRAAALIDAAILAFLGRGFTRLRAQSVVHASRGLRGFLGISTQQLLGVHARRRLLLHCLGRWRATALASLYRRTTAARHATAAALSSALLAWQRRARERRQTRWARACAYVRRRQRGLFALAALRYAAPSEAWLQRHGHMSPATTAHRRSGWCAWVFVWATAASDRALRDRAETASRHIALAGALARWRSAFYERLGERTLDAKANAVADSRAGAALALVVAALREAVRLDAVSSAAAVIAVHRRCQSLWVKWATGTSAARAGSRCAHLTAGHLWRAHVRRGMHRWRRLATRQQQAHANRAVGLGAAELLERRRGMNASRKAMQRWSGLFGSAAASPSAVSILLGAAWLRWVRHAQRLRAQALRVIAASWCLRFCALHSRFLRWQALRAEALAPPPPVHLPARRLAVSTKKARAVRVWGRAALARRSAFAEVWRARLEYEGRARRAALRGWWHASRVVGSQHDAMAVAWLAYERTATLQALKLWATAHEYLRARACVDAVLTSARAVVRPRAALRRWRALADVRTRLQLWAEGRWRQQCERAMAVAAQAWRRAARASRTLGAASSVAVRRLASRRQRLTMGRWHAHTRTGLILAGASVRRLSAALMYRVETRPWLACWVAATGLRLHWERACGQLAVRRQAAVWRAIEAHVAQRRTALALSDRSLRSLTVRKSLAACNALRAWALRGRCARTAAAHAAAAVGRLERRLVPLHLRRALRRWRTWREARAAAAEAVDGAANVVELASFFGQLQQLQSAMGAREAAVAAREAACDEAEARASRLEMQLVGQACRHAKELGAAADEVREGEVWRQQHAKRLADADAAIEALQAAHDAQHRKSLDEREETALMLCRQSDEESAALELAKSEGAEALRAQRQAHAWHMDEVCKLSAQRESEMAAEAEQELATQAARQMFASEVRGKEFAAMLAALATALAVVEAEMDERCAAHDATLQSAVRSQADLRAHTAKAEATARAAEAARMASEAAAAAAVRREEAVAASAAVCQMEAAAEAEAAARGAVEAAMRAEAAASDASLHAAMQGRAAAQRAAADAEEARACAEEQANVTCAEMGSTLAALRVELRTERSGRRADVDVGGLIFREQVQSAFERAAAAEAQAMHADEAAYGLRRELEAAWRLTEAQREGRAETELRRCERERCPSATQLDELSRELADVREVAASVASTTDSTASPRLGSPPTPAAAVRVLREEVLTARSALETMRVQRAADVAALDAQMRINARLHAKLSLVTTTDGGSAHAAPMAASFAEVSSLHPIAGSAAAASGLTPEPLGFGCEARARAQGRVITWTEARAATWTEALSATAASAGGPNSTGGLSSSGASGGGASSVSGGSSGPHRAGSISGVALTSTLSMPATVLKPTSSRASGNVENGPVDVLRAAANAALLRPRVGDGRPTPCGHVEVNRPQTKLGLKPRLGGVRLKQ